MYSVGKKTTFGAWLEQKYITFQAGLKRRASLSEFAEFIGISQPLLSQYINGDKKRPGGRSLAYLAQKFGDEVYDVLELPRPARPGPRVVDPDLRDVMEAWERLLTEDEKRAITESIRNARVRAGLPPAVPVSDDGER